MIESETSQTGWRIVATLVGGVMLVTALLARQLFIHPFYSDLLAMVSAGLLSAPLVFQAALDLWRGQTQMNEMAALGVLAAFATGEYVVAGAISFFMIVANLIEYRSALGARRSIESLIRLSPTRAHQLTDDGEAEVEAKDLQAGDRVRVRPGDNIPADGRVLTGTSTVNQASITGESLPADKDVGDEVFSGTINLTGLLDIEITRAGEDTTLGKVQQLILEAQRTRTPVMRLIDCYANWYTPTVLMLAGIVLFFTRDIGRAIAMVVIACPCAIILSGPTAVVAALGAAARLGVLIKNVVDLETARDLTAVVFDKTGTLTTGELTVSKLNPVADRDEDALLQAAAAAEQSSKHPVAKAVVEYATRRGLKAPASPDNFEEEAGKGVRAVIQGREILVGRAPWLAEQGLDVSTIDTADSEGLSVLYVTEGGEPLGWIGLEDRTRPDAAKATDALREDGVKKVVMVTGDRWSVAKRVAADLHCTDVQAEVLPHEKLELVALLKAEGHTVAVVGDGVNDAPALAAGDISVAMGAAGSDVAIHSASIALMNNELNRIPFLLHLSRHTVNVIRQNLLFSISYIALLLALSAAGYVHPVMAVLLHTGSAIAVIFNSARLVREGEDLECAVEGPEPHEVPMKAVPVDA